MDCLDLCTHAPCTSTAFILRYDGASRGFVREEKLILHENLLSVYINDMLSMKLVCTPVDLAALVVGHLFTEGRIDGIHDLRSVYVCRDGLRATVLTTRPLTAIPQPIEVRACDCGENGVLGRSLLSEGQQEAVPVLPDFQWDPEWIRTLGQAFEQGAPIYRQTHGIHSCFLLCEGRLRYRCEDIGRHNAMDKVIGRALMEGLDLTQCVLFSSGRVPDDMIEKVIRARIPVLASNTSPTDRAVELALRYHVNLICNAREGSMNVFSGPDLWE